MSIPIHYIFIYFALVDNPTTIKLRNKMLHVKFTKMHDNTNFKSFGLAKTIPQVTMKGKGQEVDRRRGGLKTVLTSV